LDTKETGAGGRRTAVRVPERMPPVRLVLALALFATTMWLGGPSFADSGQDPHAPAPEGLVAFTTFASGSDGGTTVKISTDGNIIGYASPTGYEHIGAGGFSEGYVLCYTNPFTATPIDAFDTAGAASGFGASTDVTSTTISRPTADSVLSLKQVFKFSGTNKSLQITMTVTNLTGLTVTGVTLRRQVDFDIDTGGTSGWAAFFNNFSVTADSASAWNDPSAAPVGKTAHGMVLDHVKQSSGLTHVAKVTGSILDSFCTATSAVATPVLGGDRGATAPVHGRGHRTRREQERYGPVRPGLIP
jgi:hypothetical protein